MLDVPEIQQRECLGLGIHRYNDNIAYDSDSQRFLNHQFCRLGHSAAMKKSESGFITQIVAHFNFEVCITNTVLMCFVSFLASSRLNLVVIQYGELSSY